MPANDKVKMENMEGILRCDANLVLKLSHPLKETIRRIAEDSGVTMGEWVRNCIADRVALYPQYIQVYLDHTDQMLATKE